MADPKNEDYLDDIDDVMAEEYADQEIEISDEDIEIDTLRAERDQFRDQIGRAHV